MAAALWLLGAATAARAQLAASVAEAAGASAATSTGAPAGEGRFWWAGQWNVIGQGHGAFPAAYSGPNSLLNTPEFDTSTVETVYTGYRLRPNWDLLFDVESAGGSGISQALGLAGFTNLDVVRNPALGPAPYVARAMAHWTLSLGGGEEAQTPGFLGLARKVSARRLQVYAGKFSLVDFFDQNAVGSDSHLQFMNWTVDNDGAYDYAADTRGYTSGVYAELDWNAWTARFAEVFMPKVANGLAMQYNLARARATNFELDRGYGRRWGGTLRALGYVNRADMGNYAEAIAAFQSGETTRPDIVASRRPGRHKYGFGASWDQALPADARVFGRAGWNDGHNESFVYTEVDNTLEFGADWGGRVWRRPLDKLGAAWVSNGISAGHREYLALGGLGFLLGDGGLTYGRERIVETYYTAHVWRGVYASGDAQAIRSPGYNRARGPALVTAARLHVDF